MRAAPQLTFETPERIQLSLDLAGVGSRALALLADLLLLFLCWVTVLLLWSLRGDLLSTVQGLTGALRVAAAALFFASGWCYDLGFELWGGGRTPGKRLVGLRVVRADGAPVGLTESLARNLLRAVELPFLYAPAVIAAAVTARHQRLGDLVAGTLVVRDQAYDLSRYGPPQSAAGARFRFAGGAAARALPAADFERLVDFLRRRRELLPEPRRRLAGEAARALAARAGLPAPPPPDAEPFLEALAAASLGEGG